jgi:hypothetical protein
MAPVRCLRSSIGSCGCWWRSWALAAWRWRWTGLRVCSSTGTWRPGPGIQGRCWATPDPWRTEEILRLLTWMRATTRRTPTPGSGWLAWRWGGWSSAHDAVTSYAQRAAPGSRRRAGSSTSPPSALGGRHLPASRVAALPARQAAAAGPCPPGLRAGGKPAGQRRPRVVAAARQGHRGLFHSPRPAAVAVRCRQMAENLHWWQQRTGQRVVYWAANVHTAIGQRLGISTRRSPHGGGPRGPGCASGTAAATCRWV